MNACNYFNTLLPPSAKMRQGRQSFRFIRRVIATTLTSDFFQQKSVRCTIMGRNLGHFIDVPVLARNPVD